MPKKNPVLGLFHQKQPQNGILQVRKEKESAKAY